MKIKKNLLKLFLINYFRALMTDLHVFKHYSEQHTTEQKKNGFYYLHKRVNVDLPEIHSYKKYKVVDLFYKAFGE